MKNKIYIISDFREDFPNINKNGARYFNDHPTKESIQEICDIINQLGYTCDIINGTNELIYLYEHKEKLDKEAIYLNMSDGLNQEYNRVQIPILCDLLNLKYTGGNPFIVALCCNKHYSKMAVEKMGYLVPQGILIDKHYKLENYMIYDLQFPLLVKPNNDGSSQGLSEKNICNSIDEIKNIINFHLSQYNELIIEELIDGYELTNMIIGDAENPLINEVLLISKSDKIYFEKEILTLYNKANKMTTTYIADDFFSKEIIEKIKRQSLDIYKQLHLKDIARIDYRMDKNYNLYFLEINTVPRISSTTEMKIICDHLNINFNDFIKKYIQYVNNRISHV